MAYRPETGDGCGLEKKRNGHREGVPWRQRLGRFYLVPHTVTLETPGGGALPTQPGGVLGAVTLKAKQVLLAGLFFQVCSNCAN